MSPWISVRTEEGPWVFGIVHDSSSDHQSEFEILRLSIPHDLLIGSLLDTVRLPMVWWYRVSERIWLTQCGLHVHFWINQLWHGMSHLVQTLLQRPHFSRRYVDISKVSFVYYNTNHIYANMDSEIAICGLFHILRVHRFWNIGEVIASKGKIRKNK